MANQKISARTVFTSTGLASVPVARAGSTTNYRLVHNLSATTDPGVGDDSGDGFHVGSLWFRTDTGVLWIARNVGVGAAVWVRLSAAKHFNYIANNWYQPPGVAPVNTGSSAPGANVVKLFPLYVETTVTVSDLMARVGTAVASENIQFAIYANNPATHRPTGNALGSTPNVSVAATGAVTGTLASPVTLQPGRLYWLASNISHASVLMVACTFGNALASQIVGSATAADVFNSSGTGFVGLHTATTFGTWTDLTAATITVQSPVTFNIPYIVFKVTSVP